MINQSNLPSGLIDDKAEFFGSSENIHRLANGSVNKEQQLFEPFYRLLLKEINNNEPISDCLNELGLFSERERVHKYYECNYSAFDNMPDMIDEQTIGEREYVNCPIRERCPHEGILCVIRYGLTAKEGHVLKRIALGLLDKEICSDLNMSQSNLRYYKDTISLKTSTNRKPALVGIAIKLGLI